MSIARNFLSSYQVFVLKTRWLQQLIIFRYLIKLYKLNFLHPIVIIINFVNTLRTNMFIDFQNCTLL